VVTSLLVFLVVVRLVANGRVAFLATTLFALHPVHTDSVTYLSGRRDILFTLFYLTAFYFFLCYRANRKSKYIILSFLAYLLSLGSKEMGVTLPAIFLCYDLVENYSGKADKPYLFQGTLSYLKEGYCKI
jgi:predicted membrane-bound mannosyltransferase